jgi:hypothetical protein
MIIDPATKRLTSGVVVVLSDVEGRQFGVYREMPSGCCVLYSCGGAVKFIPFGSIWLLQARARDWIYRRTSRLLRRQEQNAQVMSSLYIDELNILTYVDLGPRGTTARREFAFAYRFPQDPPRVEGVAVVLTSQCSPFVTLVTILQLQGPPSSFRICPSRCRAEGIVPIKPLQFFFFLHLVQIARWRVRSAQQARDLAYRPHPVQNSSCCP